jgi:hypothetical protein
VFISKTSGASLAVGGRISHRVPAKGVHQKVVGCIEGIANSNIISWPI